MHIPDGILPAQLCIGGYGVTGFTTWFCLHQINRSPDPTQGIPKAALLTAAFFTASLIHIPIPPASVHFVLNGLLGVVLGYYAFPAILVGLFLQAIMFGHGGLSTLGINAVIMGLPALVAALIFQGSNRVSSRFYPNITIALFGFLAGAAAIALSILTFYTLVVLHLPADLDANAEQAALLTLALAHIPLILLEGIFTAIVVSFLAKVKPELLQNSGSKVGL
ncbi:MAG: cobalt transporter CbiM [Leptolyngbyaceae cyanobacterium bins.349]|nr:cobalt transporter CbiM [Leptolyngbyaceae cyanobacterium bins.349]